MTLIEHGVRSSGINNSERIGNKGILRTDAFSEKFGFDYRPVVEKRLKYWGSLPEGHKLNFFDIARYHEGSSGLYLLEEIVGNDWVFVQAMLENGISTKHKHVPGVPELYDPLAGESTLMVNGEGHNLKTGVPFEVFPGQIHQLMTFENASLNLLVMKNSAHIPRSQLHIPVV
jgi:hypothetical protein